MAGSFAQVFLWYAIELFGLFSAGHALLHKRDPRSALGWILACLSLPGVGPCFYWLLGVNRIRTRARDWKLRQTVSLQDQSRYCRWSAERAGDALPFLLENFSAQLSLSDAVTRRPLLPGNRVEPLHNGEQAYPAMLEAIETARHSVVLSTYIFESNVTGCRFVEALTCASGRGVRVRVLLDALGEWYSFPRVRTLLRNSGVETLRFLPFARTRGGVFFNLRNHRKLLVVDGRTGFTGGMNIGDRHLAADPSNPERVIDLHFRVSGPVVSQMEEAFYEDWSFAGRRFSAPPSVCDAEFFGKAFCRGVSAGPNEDFEKLRWMFIGALNSARRRVRILTPYFLPERSVVAAINAAALRGVQVEILLPGKNNLLFVHWASRASLWELLQYGTRIYYQPPPFVHSKFLLIDTFYVLLGSANLDPRSLRLNFEFNLEVYDQELNAELNRHFDACREASTEVSLAEMDARPFIEKVRDGFFKLFSPYL